MPRARLQPIRDLDPIVDPSTGAPSTYFQRTIFEQGLLSNGLADDVEFLQAVRIIGGSGIDGEGALGDGNITLDANVQEILDGLGTTQGSIIYRGATDWAVLGPGTSGYFLKTQGPGANPMWDVGGSGGGTVTSVAASGGTTGFSFTGSPITTSGTLTLTVSNAATVRSQLGLVIGTNVQAWDTQLDSLAALSYTGNALKVIRVNAAANAFELADASAILEIDCGTAGNSGTPYISIDGGSA